MSSPAIERTIRRLAVNTREDETMRTMQMGAAALILAVAGCASHATSPTVAAGGGDKRNPDVTVVGGDIQVNPEPLHFLKGEKGTIVWHLRTKDYKFAERCVVFEPKAAGEIEDCRRRSDTTCTCENRHLREGPPSTMYKYEVRLLDASNKPLSKDPFVVND